MKVGYISNKYPEVRNIINKVSSFNYVYDKNNNWYSIRNKLAVHLKSLKILSDQQISYVFNHKSIVTKKEIDFYHFFNAVSFSGKPYIISFESFVPRNKEFFFSYKTNNNHEHLSSEMLERQFIALKKKNCKNLIAISENAKNIQINLLEKCNPELARQIQKKLLVIHPPQKSIVNNYNEKKETLDDSLIRFIFIGRHFFRKGGYEATKAFDAVCRRNPNVNMELILIGDIEEKQDNTKPVTNDEIKSIKSLIASNPRIVYYKELSNSKVLELIKKSHVGILPTWSDSYGYSVLEMQSAGTPVITSNIRALPEINNNASGWVINLPLSSTGEAEYMSVEGREEIRSLLIKGLEENMEEIIDNKAIIQEKGTKCLERIKEEHCPIKYERKLEKVYLGKVE
ncbi:hypothetical protein COL13_12285 [Bacillus cereus]|nr:hypothetical protein COL13_12285 [Bacillus cereus]